MPDSYFSFLVCDHGAVKNLYYNGRPIGEVRDGKFTPGKRTLANGAEKTLTMQDLAEPKRFQTAEQFREYLHGLIDQIDIPTS